MSKVQESNGVGVGSFLAGCGIVLLCSPLIASFIGGNNELSNGPKVDFGSPLPIGTTIYEKANVFAKLLGYDDKKIVTDTRIWPIPDDYGDPVRLYDHGNYFYMKRSDYMNARINCNSVFECRAYIDGGDDGLKDYRNRRIAINKDVNDNRYIFCDGIELSGPNVAAEKRAGKVSYPKDIVYTSSACSE